MNFSDPAIWTLAGLTPSDWTICILTVLVAIILAWLIWRLRRLSRRAVADDALPIEQIEGYPPVSVIVYAHSDERTLEQLVEQIYAQNYPADIEVIIAVDRAYDATDDIVCRLQQRHPYLLHTFAPLEARNLSRKKLALTLGVKAATHDTVVITAGNCRIPSDTWLRRMMRHVVSGHTLVAGHSVIRPVNPSSATAPGLMQRFDALRDHARWFCAALTARPLRSSGCNLVYTRSSFFANHGFASSLGLNFGDDDILVSELSRNARCAIELSADSRVEALEERPGTVMRLERLRHNFTARRLPSAPRLWFSLMSVLWWVWTILTVLSVVFTLPHLIPAIALGVVAVALLTAYMLIWRDAGRALGIPVAAWAVPWLMWVHPFYTLSLHIYGLMHKRENYTWHTI